jgi:hypothetical protein
MRTYKDPLPSRLSREQLEALPTPRLLGVLKSARLSMVYTDFSDEDHGSSFSEMHERDSLDPAIRKQFLIIDEAKEYFDLVKNICDTREHIEKHGGRRRNDGGTSSTTETQRNGKR